MKFFYQIRSFNDPTDIQHVTASDGSTVIYHNRLTPIEEECILEQKKLNPTEYYLEKKTISENILEEDANNVYASSKNYSDGEGDMKVSF